MVCDIAPGYAWLADLAMYLQTGVLVKVILSLCVHGSGT